MKKIFYSTNELDKRAISLGLSELVLQENAAGAVAKCVKEQFKGRKVLGFCGGGNNGADALAVLRMLNGEYECVAVLTSTKLNENAKTQLNIAKNAGVRVFELGEFLEFQSENFGIPKAGIPTLEFQNKNTSILEFQNELCVIDGIFGSGLSRALSAQMIELINKLNALNALKIAVDIPSGLDLRGVPLGTAFEADFTITMGALKLALFNDLAKDFVGKVITADLGLSNKVFCGEQKNDFLLEFQDLKLPYRTKQNVNKGSFGHAFIALGECAGAGKLCANAAFNIGAGKVSVVGKAGSLSAQIMKKSDFSGASAVAIGMGLGGAKHDLKSILPLPCVVDADMFWQSEVLSFAKSKKAVLTPHPKEFASLLKLAKMGDFSINEVLENKADLARRFSLEFGATLLLKGANTIIAQNGVLYICPLGSAKLAKGGSGDVLSGMIVGLLAQGYSPLNSAISAVLAQAKIALNYHKNDFSYTPNDMIKGIKCL